METKFKPNYAIHPGMLLLDDLETMEMSQKELSEKIGVSKTVINEIIKGKRDINAKIAVLLEKTIDEPANFWLNAQALYDETMARLELAATKDVDMSNLIFQNCKLAANQDICYKNERDVLVVIPRVIFAV